VQPIIVEAPNIDNEVSCHDGCLDVFDISARCQLTQFCDSSLEGHTEYVTT
jgi:hypothetical protein